MGIAERVSHDRLKEILSYEPSTGTFIWLKPSGRRVKVGDVARSKDSAGYFRVMVDNQSYRLHVLAWFYVHGVWPEHEVDHINRCRSDNRIENLRCVTRSQNQQNMWRGNQNTSGYRGVSWHRQAQKWGAKIMVGYKGISLGLYDDVMDAARAYREAAKKYHTHNQEAA